MDISGTTLDSGKVTADNQTVAERIKVGNYNCERTKFPNIFKIIGNKGGYVVRCYYGKVEKIDKETGVKKESSKVTLKTVSTLGDAKQLLRKVEDIRFKRKHGVDPQQQEIMGKVTLLDAMDAFKKDRAYTDLCENYRMHYDNYFRHVADFMGYKLTADITQKDIEDYFEYQLKRGSLDTAKRNKDGAVSKKEISASNPQGISVNTLHKHKTALKQLWKFMIKQGCYGVETNLPASCDIPKMELKIDGKTIRTSYLRPKRITLSIDELNYTLNDALQHEYDRSIAVMIALGSIGGLRRSEAVALKVGRYYHDNRMKTGEQMWELDDFSCIKEYYEEHDELILIDEAITHNSTDKLGFPKDHIIRMIGKPKCLDKIMEYAMEQRMQINDILGVTLDSGDRMYMPLRNVILQKDYSCEKLSRKWKEYQLRRNKRMVAAGLEPIPVIKYHDLRHTHATLLSDELPAMKISRNMGHVIPGKDQVNNTTTKVYIHDRTPNRSDVIKYWDTHIKLDWDKALRGNINDPGNKAHVNGSGHFVITSEEKKRIMSLRKRFVLTEEEEAELLYTKKDE